MTSLCRPWLSLGALAVYLAVNIAAGALHHHAEGPQSGKMPAADNHGLQLQSTKAAGDDCQEDACLFCSVLHLARTLPTVAWMDAVTAYAGKAVPAVAIARLHFLETASHSRAPPPAG